MSLSNIRLTLGLLFVIGSLSAAAQSPQAPAAPDQAQQKSEPIRSVNPPSLPDRSHIQHVDYLMVRLKGADSRHPRPLAPRMRDRIISVSGVALKFTRTDGGEVHIFTLPRLMYEAEAEEIAARIRLLPEVDWVDYDKGGGDAPFAVPTDPLYAAYQWSLQSGAGGANLPPAWNLTTGNSALVVAVLDTGIIKTHPEFAGRLLAGYDFITDVTRANDGGGRDADSADPGDWVTQAEVNSGGIYAGCTARNSTWHGSGTAGVLGAAANNAQGIAGVDWNVKILPVRVLGKCVNGSSGDEADIAAAIRWAAGYTVSGIANPNPAKVINLSFGRPATCPPAYQTAINDAIKAGAVVIAAVGNTEGGSALQNAPANCAGVIRVAATTRQGGLASYSNRGEAASLSAPGGEFTADPLDAIPSPGDGGTTIPLNNGIVNGHAGTSFAAPHVSGVASLMFSLRPKTSPLLIKHMLINTTRNFPVGTSFDCDNITCGTGILDAENAAWVAKSRHAGGIYHTAAIRGDGAVVTWGYNGNGQLGGGEALGVIRTSPGTPITTLPNAADVATGYYHGAAAKADGTVWTWGYNGQSQLGDGSTTDRTSPVQVAGLTNVVVVAAGDRHTLALKADGTVWAWGYNFFGQLGAGPSDFTDRATPVQVSGLTGVIAIIGGGKRSMALKNDGTVWAWGDVSNVSVDGSSASVSSVPIQVAGLADVVAIAAGGEATTGVNEDVSMALTFDGKVYTWGYNSFGQLGIGNVSTKFLPQLVTALTLPAVQISTGGNHATALLEDGTLWTWGFNGDGELGDGTTTYRTLPVLISAGLSKTVDIVAGPHHTLAFAGDTSLRAWGYNAGGQLGDGTQSNRLAPAQVHGQGNAGFYYSGYTSSSSVDLSVSMTDSPDPITVGGNLTYSMLLLNGGASAATNVQAVFALPTQASFLSATAGCAFVNASVTCNLGTLASGGSSSVQVVVQPTVAGALNASVSVSSDLFDPNSANNVAAVTTTVTPVVTANDADVPTLPEWGAILMGSLLLANVVWMQKRKYRH